MAFLDKAGLERLWLHIISNLNKKVDKVEGKGLSTNDYTTEDKARLATLDTLVGDTSVADQINTAIDTKADVSHTHDIEDINDYYGVIRKTGDIISANSLEGLSIHPITHIEPVQAGSGDPSPDNVRPISGLNSVNVMATGKNLFDGDVLLKASGWAHEGGVYHGPGSALHGVFGNGVSGIKYKPNTQYTFSFTGKAESETSEAYCIIYYVEGGNSGAMTVNSTSDKKYTLTSAAGKTVDRLCLSYGSHASHTWLSDLQLEEGNAPTAYVPYQGQTLTADLPETVYGGTLDWGTGVLTVDRGIMKMSDIVWISYTAWGSDHTFYAHGFAQANFGGDNAAKVVAEAYTAKSQSEILSGSSDGYYIRGDTAVLYVSDARYTDYESFRAGVTGYIVYPLANPYTIQLTPQQLNTLKGTNNVWSNAGKTEALINLTYVNTDASLTSANTPANAKAVGDALAGKQPIGNYALKNEIPSVPVQSVNNKTGAVTLTASDVGALDVDDYYGIVDKTDNIITFNSLEKLSIHPTTYIEPVQAGSGDPSPDNVRPISGWDSVTVQRTGKNLFNVRGLVEQYSAYVRIEEDKIVASPMSESGTSYVLFAQKYKAGKYTIRASYTGDGVASARLLTSAQHTGGIYNEFFGRWYSDFTDNTTIDVAEDFTVGIGFNGIGGGEAIIYDIMIAAGDTNATYEPYQGQTLTADLPETVYGGKLDWNTGVLTVTHKKRIIDSLAQQYENIGSPAVVAGAMYIADMRAGGRTDGWCDALPSKPTPAWVTSPGITFGAGGSDLYVVLPSDRAGTTLESINTYLAANPLTIVYPLATPYTIQLSPQKLETLKGVNNVWSNNGGMTRVLGNLTFTDTTLTLPNMAADAKAVGDAINAIAAEYAINADWNVNDSSTRSNVHTLDQDGNAWFAGTVEGTGIILKSSTSGSTKRFLITVNDSGTLSTTEIT